MHKICIKFASKLIGLMKLFLENVVQGFGKALVESVVAELGDGITPEVRSALQATVFAVRSAAGVCPIDKQHRQSMASTLKAANQDGSLGPKTFTK